MGSKLQDSVSSKGYEITPYEKAVGSYKRNALISELTRHVISSFSKREDTGTKTAKTKIPSVLTKPSFELKTVPFSRSGFIAITKGKELPAEDNKAAISPKMAFHKSGSSSRVRDWNPDVRVAQRMGVTITYASRSKEIREFLQQ